MEDGVVLNKRKKRSILNRMIFRYHLLRFRLLNLMLTDVKLILNHLVFVKGLNKNSVVIDLGANKGQFSKEISKLYNSTCHAIEPNIELYKNLKQENIIAANYAINYSDGPVNFYISSNPEGSSIIKNFENLREQYKKATVEGITFKTLLDKLNITNKKIDIVKVDIEGAELELIDSLTENDTKNIKQITIEFHDWLNESLHERTVTAINKLMSFGFNAYSYGYINLRPVEMLFLNKKFINFNLEQKFYLRLCRSVPYPFPIIRKFSSYSL